MCAGRAAPSNTADLLAHYITSRIRNYSRCGPFCDNDCAENPDFRARDFVRLGLIQMCIVCRGPGEAGTGTRQLVVPLRDADFGVGPEHLPQGFADFAHGRVGADGVNDIWHRVGRCDGAICAALRLQ